MTPKFRASIIGLEKLIEVNKINFSNSGDIYINNYPGQDFYLMQSTGLHDNTKFEDLSEEEQEEWLESGKTADEWHGREIFEGDILKSRDGTDGLISRFIVKRDEFYTGFTPMNREGCGFNRAMCEVIGNVHQYPELLEV